MKMMQVLILVLFSWIAGQPDSAHAEVIFDNLTGASIPTFGPECCRVGNEVTLGETARNISLLKLGVSSQGVDLIAGIEMGIYANDGPSGSPGSVLWQSGPLTGLLVKAEDTFIAVPVPFIGVPDVITIT